MHNPPTSALMACHRSATHLNVSGNFSTKCEFAPATLADSPLLSVFSPARQPATPPGYKWPSTHLLLKLPVVLCPLLRLSAQCARSAHYLNHMATWPCYQSRISAGVVPGRDGAPDGVAVPVDRDAGARLRHGPLAWPQVLVLQPRGGAHVVRVPAHPFPSYRSPYRCNAVSTRFPVVVLGAPGALLRGVSACILTAVLLLSVTIVGHCPCGTAKTVQNLGEQAAKVVVKKTGV